MSGVWLASAAAACAYAALMGFFLYWWRRLPPVHPVSTGDVRFSVVVAFRNEAHRIAYLLEALKKLRYPTESYEVIFVDDHSTDGTAAVIEAQGRGIPYRVLSLPPGRMGKKAALTHGIRNARHPVIALTDADCGPGPQWLDMLAGCFSRSRPPVLVSGPIRLEAAHLPGKVLALEQWGLVGIGAASMTAGRLTMVNGGNMAFLRSAFEAVNGYAGIDHFAAGDDELLAHRLASQGPVCFAATPEATVSTLPPATFRQWWHQRLRWAAASAHYENGFAKAVSLATAALHILTAASVTAALLGHGWAPALTLLGGKALAEVPFLYAVTRKMGAAGLLKYYPPGAVYYLVYVPLITIRAIFGPKSYRWKGRKAR